MTKTWKIGEYCKGGVITAEIHKHNIIIICKDWDTSKGWSTKSDQSNAREFTRLEVPINDFRLRDELDTFLNDLTTCYYAEQVLDWIFNNKN